VKPAQIDKVLNKLLTAIILTISWTLPNCDNALTLSSVAFL
jgi:hypothetical protein